MVANHPRWREGDHAPALRVWGIPSGSGSGPEGSARGQQPFREGQRVREAQPRFEGWLPTGGGRIERDARMALTPRSVAAGKGIQPFRDPARVQDFQAPRPPIDVRATHRYAVRWGEREALLSIDRSVVRRCAGPPMYPMPRMLAIFDFPDDPGPAHAAVPRPVVESVRGTRCRAAAS